MSTSASHPRIALLVNYLDRSYQSNFRAALERQARARGADLLVAVGRELQHELPHERALNQLYRWLSPASVDGVVVLSAAISNFSGKAGIQALCRELAPLPSCSIGLELPELPSIIIDNRSAMKTAAAHLIVEHGCRHIAYVGGPAYNEEARERLLGYQDALQEAGIAFDPERVSAGHFTTETGRSALQQILERGVQIDAVAAANDYMALGAIDALLERGLDVPERVKVVGFDDAPIARFARRSLTTIAQPFDEMAALALDALIGQLQGRGSARTRRARVRMVTRESCGCGYVRPTAKLELRQPALPASAFLRSWADQLDRGQRGPDIRAPWELPLPRLARGLADELDGEPAAFLRCIERVADEAAADADSVEELGRALLELQRSCQEAGYAGAAQHELEQACRAGQNKASAISHREHGRRALRVMDDAAALRAVSQDLAMMLSSPALANSFRRALQALGIRTGYLAVCSGRDLKPLLALESGSVVNVDESVYPARQLFPRGFPAQTGCSFLTLLPLTLEDQVMGLVAFSSQSEAFVCEALRSQLSAALKLSSLHARVVEETAVRERLAHEQLLGELGVARRIQGALCPSDPRAPGFELAARLVAAAEVGGDYYDVLPTSDGCWIGIGDVTGHGLLAGLIMLMIQSSVSTAVRGAQAQTPSQVVCRVNAVLECNIRRRLHAREHATFLLLRAHADGRLLMAGAHEDVIVYRSATGRCELIETTGVWLGINEEIADVTVDIPFEIAVGDTVVLYTDGLIEARDASDRELDIQSVCEIVQSTAAQGPNAIVQALIEKARAWTPVQLDDITIVALRRVAASVAPGVLDAQPAR